MQCLATRNCSEVQLKTNHCNVTIGLLYFETSHVRQLVEFCSHIGERNLQYDPKTCMHLIMEQLVMRYRKIYICPYKCIFERMDIFKSCKPDAIIIQVGSNGIDYMDATSIV